VTGTYRIGGDELLFDHGHNGYVYPCFAKHLHLFGGKIGEFTKVAITATGPKGPE
jgi:hypothetical protein